jgi:hypothetical protein
MSLGQLVELRGLHDVNVCARIVGARLAASTRAVGTDNVVKMMKRLERMTTV